MKIPSQMQMISRSSLANIIQTVSNTVNSDLSSNHPGHPHGEGRIKGNDKKIDNQYG